jgi:hypothetical protein
MFSYLRGQFGTAGLVVAIIALVAALAGGAYAATGGLSGKQKREVRAIAKGFQGIGPTGPIGPKGDPGSRGESGAPGKDGTSATTTPFNGSKGGCNEGGVEVKSASPPAFVCNGATGFTATLPEGETETGTWGGHVLEDEPAFLPISLNIPLASAPAAILVKPGEDNVTGCPGVTGGVPSADPGKLCIYAGTFAGTFEGEAFFDPTKQLEPGTEPNGTIFVYTCKAAECFSYGSWAATGS